MAEEAQWLRYPAISPDGETIVFSYRGDLWRVPSGGGTATPLTLHQAHDTRPIWSPDGETIAFASDRYGNFDVWTIPATGGEATRLTFHSSNDMPMSFAPGGKSVLFSSSRLDAIDCVQYPTGAQPELYEVALEGGMPDQVLTTPAMYAVFDDDRKRLVYSDEKGYEDEWRKHDDSSFARDVWVHDVSSGKHTRLTEFGHDDRQPVWAPGQDSIYYLSESSGTFNVWKLGLTDGAEPAQVTRHENHPVRFLSIAENGDIAYAWDGSLYVKRAADRRGKKIRVEAAADRRTNAQQLVNVAGQISEFDASPKGEEIAFIARGEVFVTSTKHGDTRQITYTPEQERSLSFSPDGRSLLYASERNGSWNLYRMNLGDEDEPDFFNATLLQEEAILEIPEETFQPQWSPDGKEVAYLQERVELKVIQLENGKTRTILPAKYNYSYIDGDQWYRWSPDGKHFLVEFVSPTRWSSEIGLLPAAGGADPVNLTKAGYEDVIPQWTLEGKAMYWYTDRYGSRLEAGWSAGGDLKLAFFTQEAFDRYRLSEIELEQLKAKEEKEEKKKKKEEGKEDDDGDKKKKGKKDEDEEEDDDEDEIKLPDPVELELDGLEDRTIRLTTHSSRLAGAALTEDAEKLVYLARFEKGYDLWLYKHRKEEVKLLAKIGANNVGGLTLSKDGKTAFMLVDNSLRTVELESGKVTPVKMAASIDLDAAAERDYMFEHVWRQTLKKFHDVDMHGVDWGFYKKEYKRFLPYIDTNWDFAELLSEMLGELNASHTGSGYRSRREDRDQTAALGFFPDPDWDKPGIRIAEIMEKSPLLKAENEIAEGHVITAIDGKTIGAGENWYPLLNRKAGKPTRLTLSDPESDKTWDERVKPIGWGEQGRLLYDRWVRSRRAEVDRLSKGRIGYTHIRGMNDGSFREIFEDIFGEALTKEAIVLDTRFNGGGNLDEALTVFLSGEVFMTAWPRGQYLGGVPSRRWTKPSIVVQNEGNYSDAHCFPNGYRTLGLGEVVGTQVPGTCTAVWWETLQDRSLYFGIPQVTWTDVDGDALENKHFDPDHWVDNDPQLESQGRDEQLEKAVEVLLKGL
ncbi:MAG: peptidase S41 [Acidobacteria bacterium]|nr:peptidase S41 [Acidobacteriota bacterium]NIM63884.1 peptidase S41 [Acidobacteriota bacterium]NIO60153.1 peptidase S41 [Acidobacteriota bacterium]NIQ31217.1 peptidase S41 [Acidobacteriota bacterium]NIQ86354.1 peptidase S41 [Acidobacteriota bacterium]